LAGVKEQRMKETDMSIELRRIVPCQQKIQIPMSFRIFRQMENILSPEGDGREVVPLSVSSLCVPAPSKLGLEVDEDCPEDRDE